MSDLIEDLELGDERIMSDEEMLLAAQVYRAIQRAATGTDRSKQAQGFLLGISDLGTCSERTRRLLAGVPEEPRDKLEAFLGTWVGTGVEEAVKAAHPEVVIQASVTVELTGDQGNYILDGHPDMVFGWGVADGKSANGLEVPKRVGPNQQQRFQRNLYVLGAHNAGLLAVPLEQAKAANIWIDRSGRTKELYVQMETYDPEIVNEATAWLDQVVYDYRQGQESMKEPPRPWCEKVCGHYETCRLFDTDVTGLITDPEIEAAVRMHNQGKALFNKGKRLKDEASAALAGVTGYIDGFQVRWSHVNGGQVAFERKGYERLSITAIKPKDVSQLTNGES